MPNRWETNHGLNLTGQRRATKDHDGLRNIGEFGHHTDPADVDSDDDGSDDGDEVHGNGTGDPPTPTRTTTAWSTATRTATTTASTTRTKTTATRSAWRRTTRIPPTVTAEHGDDAPR